MLGPRTAQWQVCSYGQVVHGGARGRALIGQTVHTAPGEHGTHACRLLYVHTDHHQYRGSQLTALLAGTWCAGARSSINNQAHSAWQTSLPPAQLHCLVASTHSHSTVTGVLSTDAPQAAKKEPPSPFFRQRSK